MHNKWREGRNRLFFFKKKLASSGGFFLFIFLCCCCFFFFFTSIYKSMALCAGLEKNSGIFLHSCWIYLWGENKTYFVSGKFKINELGILNIYILESWTICMLKVLLDLMHAISERKRLWNSCNTCSVTVWTASCCTGISGCLDQPKVGTR